MASNSLVAKAAGSDDVQDRDRLAYLADLARELKKIADDEGCLTLSGILQVAEVEARQQVLQRLRAEAAH
ncbi:MAG: hypothetical protein JSS20_08000 [Proteobacteria bacterium]|nr:hypothetical protein [Pseudomonadota bacterium]